MSGIAGIVHFDEAPLAPDAVRRMTAAMASRGPEGITHWVTASAALGHCALRTTPESLDERQPLANEDGSLVLVMDGRVDNGADLRRELQGRGAVLRDRTDAELVLRAYETWGEACPQHIVGEFVFVAWDVRARRLFAARDAAGTRHVYYHAGRGWCAFASEIKGLLALDRIEPRLNESRLLDYLSIEYDRDDEVGTFYQEISRLPAGHAMRVTEHGVRTWRYWDPGELPARQFRSLDECAEAFLEQFRIAVACRLRSVGPVGAMLSGGLDSSSIVGLISTKLRAELSQPLKTYSLVLENREQCLDWPFIQDMLRDEWLDPTVISSAIADDVWREHVDGIDGLDEPFGLTNGFTDGLVYRAAAASGCRVVLDGMAGDSLFYGFAPSADRILRRGLVGRVPAAFAGWRRHAGAGTVAAVALVTLNVVTPRRIRPVYRMLRDRYAPLSGELRLLRDPVARRFLGARRLGRQQAVPGVDTDQAIHARSFTTGALSFAQEIHGQLALSAGVEPRSPFADRRLIEFAIQMPLEAKLFGPWYKLLLRTSMAGILPDAVRWRRRVDGHPGWNFFEHLIVEVARQAPEFWHEEGIVDTLTPWVEAVAVAKAWHAYKRRSEHSTGYDLFRLAVLARWLKTRRLPQTPPAIA